MLGIIVYILLYFFTIYYSQKYKRAVNKSLKSKKNFFLLGMIITFSLIIGLRWEVGKDFSAYYDLLIGNVPYWEYDRLEPLSKWTIQFVQKNHLPFYIWFIFTSFLQIFFLFCAFKKEITNLLPWGVFFFLVYTLSFNMNVVRQGCALSIVLYAYTFIAQKDWKRYVLFIVFAALFHKSAIVFLPLYFTHSIAMKLNVFMQLAIFFAFTFVGTLAINLIINATGSYWEILNMAQKVDQLAGHEWEIQQGSGLGIIFTQIRLSLIILFSQKMRAFYCSKRFEVFYLLFFIGSCFYTSTMNDMLLERMCRYFSICDVVISAYFINYLINVEKQYTFVAYTILIGLIAMTSYEFIFGLNWKFVPLF